MFLLMASEAFSIMQSTFASLSYYMACSLDHASSSNIKGLTPPREQNVPKFHTRKTAASIPTTLK